MLASTIGFAGPSRSHRPDLTARRYDHDTYQRVHDYLAAVHPEGCGESVGFCACGCGECQATASLRKLHDRAVKAGATCDRRPARFSAGSVTFAGGKGGGGKAKAGTPKDGGLVGAVVDAVTGGGCGSGAGGFKLGNTCGRRRNQSLLAAQKAHTAAKHAARKASDRHARLGTAESLAGARAAASHAAKTYREHEAAVQSHRAGQAQARRNKAAEARATRKSMTETMTAQAHQRLEALKADVAAGRVSGADAIGHLDRIARGVTRDELHGVAARAGIGHEQTTKVGLLQHLRGNLLDAAPKARAADARDPSTHGDHEPGHVGYLKTDLIHHDPHRFQYKLGHTETGSVGSLAGVQTYNHDLGGVLSVWKDPANGKVFVVNGHNRLDLAKRLGADKVTVRFLDAKDAQEARATGALQNISEGRGTAIDSGKFYRDTGLTAQDVATLGIPIGEKINRDGQALAALEEKGFRRVIDGSLTVDRGAIIGGSGLSHAQQRGLLALVDRRGKKRGDDLTNAQLRELVDDVKAAPTARKETHDLFGSSVEEENLAVNRARVSSYIKDKLSKERKLFGLVSRGKNSADLERGGNTIDAARSGQIADDAAAALNVFDQHKRLAGPVSRELNDAAERIHAGETPKKVYDDAYKRIFQAVRATLGGS